MIQEIEVNIIHLLLDVSETSIMALPGYQQLGYDPPIFVFFFPQAPAQLRPYSFHLFCSFQDFLQSSILCNLVVACSQSCLFVIDFYNFLELRPLLVESSVNVQRAHL